MLTDAQHFLSDAQAITATAASTNQHDNGVAGRAPGNATRVVATIEETFTLLTSLTFTVRSADNAGMSTNLTTHQAVAVTLASGKLAAGQQIDLGELLDGTRRFVDVNYTVAGTNPGAGKVTTVLHPFGSNQTIPGQA